MRIQAAEQSVLRATQSVLTVMLGMRKPNKNECANNQAHTAALYREMTVAGDRLLEVLRFELKFRKIDLSYATGEVLERWRICQSAVELCGEEYVAALTNWREAIVEDCKSANHQRHPHPRVH